MAATTTPTTTTTPMTTTTPTTTTAKPLAVPATTPKTEPPSSAQSPAAATPAAAGAKTQPVTPTPAPAPPIVEEVEDLKQQEKDQDYSGEYGKRIYCRRLYKSMMPLRILFVLGGRYPFGSELVEDGTYEYKFLYLHPWAIYFFVIFLLMLYILFVGAFEIVHISLNFSVSTAETTAQYQRQRGYEDLLIYRYFIPLIFVYSSLIHGCLASYLTIKKRHYIAHYLMFWSKAVYTMHMDVSKSALVFCVKFLIMFVIVIIIIALFSIYKIGPSSVGLPTIFGDLLFRAYLDNDGWLETNTSTRQTVHLLGAIFLILTFTASKASVLFFIYHCKILQSAFAFWNGRVYAAVLRGGEFAQTEEGRTTYKLLFKDHCVLMDLLEGMDQVFAFKIESYFGCQVLSLFFELYFCIRSAKHGDNRMEAAYPPANVSAFFVRPRDWAPGLLMIVVSVSLMFNAAKSAASVAEEAMAGLEVLRRRTLLGRKSDEELYFMLSMFSSYTAYKKMEITGGGYYYMNKDFIIGLVSTILSYFIILYQFQPAMDRSYPASASDNETRAERIRYGTFLAGLEGLESDHFETTTSQYLDEWENFRHGGG